MRVRITHEKPQKNRVGNVTITKVPKNKNRSRKNTKRLSYEKVDRDISRTRTI